MVDGLSINAQLQIDVEEYAEQLRRLGDAYYEAAESLECENQSKSDTQ